MSPQWCARGKTGRGAHWLKIEICFECRRIVVQKRPTVDNKCLHQYFISAISTGMVHKKIMRLRIFVQKKYIQMNDNVIKAWILRLLCWRRTDYKEGFAAQSRAKCIYYIVMMI